MVCEMAHNNVKLGMVKLTSGIIKEVKEGRKVHLGLIDQLVLINQGREVNFRIDRNGVMIFRDMVCVTDLLELKKRILEEGHKSGLSIHPDATKMYQDLKKMFLWSCMNKDVAEFVYSYLTYQNSKIEH